MHSVHRETFARGSVAASPLTGRFARGIRDICHGPIVGRMTAAPTPVAVTDHPGARALGRGISATWWYTLSGVTFFAVAIVFAWTATLYAVGAPTSSLLICAIGGLAWIVACVLLTMQHRIAAQTDETPSRVGWLVPLAVCVAYGIALGLVSGSWMLGISPILQGLVLMVWPRGVRLRVTIGAEVALIVAWVVDARGAFEGAEQYWWAVAIYCLFLPPATVSSIWWWDVLVTLDRARASEARLAATQERLRVATDVHDLQGHHLQVIALQLELAERLMARDAGAALEQVRLARASVDEARQGTRDLATRFRQVPLGDELANAADLLRAAGLTVTTSIAADADAAPASALGPVIRETTTNVLRHGGRGRARLTLAREGRMWRYEIANDVAAGATPSPDGSGLEGIGRRVADAGGALDVRRGEESFVVSVSVPATATDGGAR